MRGLLLGTAAGALVIDVVTKSVAVGVLDPGNRVPVLGDVVAWLLIRNPGAAFSWGADSTVYLTLILAAIVGVVAWRGRSVASRAAAVALGLLLGGVCGNLADRLFRGPGPMRGAVVDFVSVGWAPIFNAADVCVLAGVAALAWRLLAGPSAPHAERYGWDADDRF
jgi:signal peptidase II